ncbi:MAG: hypothetical protein SangKO_040520 [Sandaracinaceae bacterium]
MADETVFAALKRRVARAKERSGLAQLASELGHAVASSHLVADEARKLSRAFGRARRGRDAFDRGYLSALSDLLAATSSAMSDASERAAARQAIEAAADLDAIIVALGERAMTPTELAEAIGDAPNNGGWTRKLQKLEQLGLVEPAPAGDKRRRPRQLSARGHRLALELEAERPSRDDQLIADVVAMTSLLRCAREVTEEELCACVTVESDERARLVRSFLEAAEMCTLLDLKMDGRVRWGRDVERWDAVLARPDQLAEAFGGVPPDAVLTTDEVGSWQEALSAGAVRQVVDVVPFRLAEQLSRDFAACVVTDRTVARALGESIPHEKLYVAFPLGEHGISVQPFVGSTLASA